jgi:putative flavoprotein involved in K+ transport
MQVVVVGAGAGGLSTAAALRHRGVPAVVLERGDAVGTAWRGRYDSLHLHTIRPLSGLPGTPIPRAEGRWVSRDGVVRYLERYARDNELNVRTGKRVERIDRDDGHRWRLATSGGELGADAS